MDEERGRSLGSVVVGVILVGLGLLFLAAQYVDLRLWFGFDFWHYFWPSFVIIPGLAFFAGMLLGGKRASGLAIPGSIITTVGLILLYQNTSNHWQSWAYAWALIPAAVGFGLVLHGAWSGQQGPMRAGRAMLVTFGAIFLAGLVFFEFVLNLSGWARGTVAAVAGPALLILLGLWLLVRPKK